MKATKMWNPVTGEFSWYGEDGLITDPLAIAEIEESCADSCCSTAPVKRLWSINATGENGILGERWRANAAPHNVIDEIFSGEAHVNGAPDEVVTITNNWALADTDFPATGGDRAVSQEKYTAWVYLTQPTVFMDNNGNTGEWLSVDMNGCGCPLERVAAFGPTVTAANGLGEWGEFVPGLYKISVKVSDFSVFGGFSLQHSTDGGETFSLFPMSRTWAAQPAIECQLVRICDDAFEQLDGTPIEFDAETMSCCEIACPKIEPKPTPTFGYSAREVCDDVDGDPANYVTVTRETVVVDGVRTVNFFTNYGLENEEVHTLQGVPVDCATGEPIADEPILPECEDWEILDAYLPVGTSGVNVERWNGTDAASSLGANTVASQYFTGDADYSGMPSHPNAFTSTTVEPDLLVLDNVADASQMRYWTYLYTTESIRLRELFNRAETVDYYLGECCSDPILEATGEYFNDVASGASFDVTLPAGVHYIGGLIHDHSAFSGVNYEYSVDGGQSWSRVPASWLYTAKPPISKCPVKYCPETQVFADAVTGEQLGSEVSLCQPDLCSPVDILESPKQYMPAGLLWKWNEQEPGVGVEYWQPAALGGSAVDHDNVTNIFGTDLTAHPNSPDRVFTMNTLNVSTPTPDFLDAAGFTDRAETSGTDQIRVTFYVCSDAPFDLADSNSNTGERGAITLDGVLLAEDTTDSDTNDRSSVPAVTIPAGVHKIVAATSDLSAWQGYQPSLPDGLEPYAEPLSWTPMQVFKCTDLSGGYVDCDGNPVEVEDKDSWTDLNSSECLTC